MKNKIYSSLFFQIIIAFLIFSGIFLLLREPISKFSSTILYVIGDIRPTSIDFNIETSSVENQLNTKQSKKIKTKQKKQKKRDSKPQLTKLPKTSSFYIPILSATPNAGTTELVTLPEMRKFNGKKWEKESTTIKVGIYNNDLYFFIACSDKNPENIETNFSKKNQQHIWKDDGLEIFLMKNKDADTYCQYLVSPAGYNYCYYLKTIPNRLDTGNQTKIDKHFKFPYTEAEITDNGYNIELKVSLENINIKPDNIPESILIQIVRNYRNMNNKDHLVTQLYPTHIYVDNRFGASNHNQKAFIPSEILKK